MIGNNIVTLASIVTKDKKFYLYLFCCSPYSIISLVIDKFIVQIILNCIITVSIATIG